MFHGCSSSITPVIACIALSNFCKRKHVFYQSRPSMQHRHQTIFGALFAGVRRAFRRHGRRDGVMSLYLSFNNRADRRAYIQQLDQGAAARCATERPCGIRAGRKITRQRPVNLATDALALWRWARALQKEIKEQAP